MAKHAGTSAGAKVALAAIVVGAIVAVIGVAGGAADWGSSTSTTRSLQPVASGTPATTTPTSAAARNETPLEFVVHLDTAIRNHDVTFLVSRLHPAVIARYGEAQCRAFVPHLDDHYVVTGTSSPPAQYAYTSDGKTTQVANVVAVPVRITQPDGTSTSATLHTVKVGGTYRYFIDCTQ